MIHRIKYSWCQSCEWLEKNEWLVLILLLVGLLRVATIFEPIHYGDEDIYLTLGMGWRRGLVLYRDIFDHKPPMIYWLAGLAGGITFFKLMLFFWSLLGVVGLWNLARRLWSGSYAVVLSTAVFAALTTLPLLEGNIVNAELFMIVPVIYGVGLLLSEKTAWWEFLLVGGLLGVGFLFKVPVIVDLAAVVIWFFVYQKKSWREWWRFLIDRRFWLLILGFLLPIALTMVVYAINGALADYLLAAGGFNFSYIRAFEGERRAIWEIGLFQRSVVLLVVLLGLLVGRRFWGKRLGLIMLWLAFAVFGVTLAGRPYPHYWVQATPAAALLIGGILAEKKRQMAISLVLAGVIVSLAIWQYGFWSYPVASYYKNFGDWTTGQKNTNEYKDYFGEHVRRNEEIARYIRERTREDERIFVWGSEPGIYVLSERLPVGKYTTAFHIRDFEAYVETEMKLREEMPRFIILMDYEKSFDLLDKILDDAYTEVERVKGASIYRKLLW